MSEGTEPQSTPVEPVAKRSFFESLRPRGVPFFVLCVLLFLFALYQSGRLWMSARAHADQIERSNTAHAQQLDSLKQMSAQDAADACAASLHQLFVMRSQFPEISNRTFQAFVKEVSASGRFSLIVVADSTNKVMASTDLTLIGSTAPTGLIDGQKYGAMASVKDADATLGTVWLVNAE